MAAPIRNLRFYSALNMFTFQKLALTTFSVRTASSVKVPSQPTWKPIEESQLPAPTSIDNRMIDHLERLALVDFGNEEGINRLTKAIRFADQMSLVDTSNVEPMSSVLEDREDKVTEGNCRKDLMRLPKKRVEEYYVSPPGNIPLAKSEIEENETVAFQTQRESGG